MIRVLIADDHTIFREGLRRILEEDGRLQIVGEAVNSAEALSMARSIKPDVVILDFAMPGRGGLEVLEELKSSKGPRVLVLTSHPEDHVAVRCLRAGADGYVTKERAGQDVIQAIVRVSKGRKYITPLLAERLAQEIGPQSDRPPHEQLSAREYQVFLGLGRGKRVSDLAKELALSPHTVSTYRSRILEKLSLRTTPELIRYAMSYGLVD